MEAVIEAAGRELARIEAALGSPARPMDAARLHAKVTELASDRLDGVLDSTSAPAHELAAAAGLL
jgi:hypothetical protein